MAFNTELAAHLATGATTTCTAWAITRSDGVVLGFTDHDGDLVFDGITFRADSGLTASALQQSAGLSVDNTEAMGALSAFAISEADIAAGFFDGAGVQAWLVNWADVAARQLIFLGSIGQITRAEGAFHAELRGLSEALNQGTGRSYQRPCAAVLGDAACGVDLGDPAFYAEVTASAVSEARVFALAELPDHAAGWFSRGMLRVLDGSAEGLAAPIKSDSQIQGQRMVELWAPLPVDPGAAPLLRLEAGCDKRLATCGGKFGNIPNYQGFPDIPGDDWLMVQPASAGQATGGSRR